MDERTDNLPAVTAEASMPCLISSEKPKPVTASEFAKHVAPVLTLVAPSGMTGDERKAWSHAAFKALDGIPSDLLERGAAVAMVKADHPSRIVSTIHSAIEQDWTARISEANRKPIEPRPLPLPAPIETDEERVEREEVAKLMRGLRLKLEANCG